MVQECWQLVADRASMPSKVYSIAMIQSFSTKRFELTEGRSIIGRDENCCDIVLPGIHVSRQHAELTVSGGRVIVKDLNSSNGTFVNGRKVSQAELRPGDQVCFDTITLTVFAPDEDPDVTIVYTREPQDELEGTMIRPDEVAAISGRGLARSGLKERLFDLPQGWDGQKSTKLTVITTAIALLGLLFASVWFALQ